MKKRLTSYLLILLTFITVVGCSNNNQEANYTDSNKLDENTSQILRPSNLVISVGEYKIEAILGTYTWSYIDDNGIGASIAADADAPTSIVEKQEPVKVNSNTIVTLEFEMFPTQF
ncbi:hypothetical protein [Bacillus solitudinis]|uniref:hypothetical protein n=1 Tax=Bacillus solitudinis TaxID=2014074 RepID=UPI000C230E7E|nr:hypothetical protein [Bacillus solitudinis]